jgi:hypothetical protein
MLSNTKSGNPMADALAKSLVECIKNGDLGRAQDPGKGQSQQ